MKKNSVLFALLSLSILTTVEVSAQEILPRPEQPFKGHIGLSVSSKSHRDLWPVVAGWLHERGDVAEGRR